MDYGGLIDPIRPLGDLYLHSDSGCRVAYYFDGDIGDADAGEYARHESLIVRGFKIERWRTA